MLLIGFALALAALVGMRTPLDETGPLRPAPARPPVRRVLPLAVIAAASVFNYSLPGCSGSARSASSSWSPAVSSSRRGRSCPRTGRASSPPI